MLCKTILTPIFMKSRSVFITTLLILIAFIPEKSISAQYTLTDEDVVVVDGVIEKCTYGFAINDIVIPDTLDGQTVIGIDNRDDLDPVPVSEREGVFTNKYITGLKLPSSIEFIGDFSFRANLISDLDLTACSALRSIGERTFEYNRLASVDLSACIALKNIGSGAFKENQISDFSLPVNLQNQALGWIDANGSNISGGDQVSDLESFYFVPATYTLTDEDVEVTDGVIQSCSYHFGSRRLIIPDTLDGQAILGFAEMAPMYVGMGYYEPLGIFSRRGLIHVKFPKTIKEINNNTFRENQLSGIDLSECTALTTIGNRAFEDNYSLTTLDLRACISLKHIGINAFRNNDLATLDLSTCMDLRTIERGSFISNRLTSVNLSECSSLMKIGGEAFSDNDLSEIDLSGCKSLTSVGNYAFFGNTMSSFVLPVNNEYDAFG